METTNRLLYVDDDFPSRDLFPELFGNRPLEIETCKDGINALTKLESFPADIVVTGLTMPNMGGMALLDAIRVRYPEIVVVMVSDSANVNTAMQAMRAGAYDYLVKPEGMEALPTVIDTITGMAVSPANRNFIGKDQRKKHRFEDIVGRDPSMSQVFRRIAAVAESNAHVLITGETGTGKGLTASAIHYRSLRRKEPFTKVNCAALTETLSGSELFGHEKGAFTGAVSQKKGYFEIADKGSIFLDEIGDIPLSTQVALLHVIESGTFQRVGSTRSLSSNARVICATNRSLPEMVAEKHFREDLFYRINVVTIEIPPLRERRSDIPELAAYFLAKYCKDNQRNIKRISRAAMKMLIRHDWPGNIRELANTIENAVIFCGGHEIVPSNLEKLKGEKSARDISLALSSWSLPQAEANLIRRVLSETFGNINQAAQLLDIARGTLYSKMNRYGIQRPQAKRS